MTSPGERLRDLMRPVVEEWDRTTEEPVPSDFLELVDKLK